MKRHEQKLSQPHVVHHETYRRCTCNIIIIYIRHFMTHDLAVCCHVQSQRDAVSSSTLVLFFLPSRRSSVFPQLSPRRVNLLHYQPTDWLSRKTDALAETRGFKIPQWVKLNKEEDERLHDSANLKSVWNNLSCPSSISTWRTETSSAGELQTQRTSTQDDVQVMI